MEESFFVDFLKKLEKVRTNIIKCFDDERKTNEKLDERLYIILYILLYYIIYIIIILYIIYIIILYHYIILYKLRCICLEKP